MLATSKNPMRAASSQTLNSRITLREKGQHLYWAKIAGFVQDGEHDGVDGVHEQKNNDTALWE